MAIAVLILGPSGSGKSASLRNFEPDEIGIFNVAGKPLPFRKALPMSGNASYGMILKTLERANKKAYVIDDSQYLMANEFFDRARETGYQKYTDIGLHFRNLIQYISQMPDDVIVYFLHHTEEGPDGRLKAKTIGKMLDEKLTVEGMFSIVLLAEADADGYWFVTQSDGISTAKSPMEMFDRFKIENDLKAVDTRIREYYEIAKGESNE